MALESLSGTRTFTEKSDVWSFGVLCWEIMTRCCLMPYSDIGGGWTGLLCHLKEGGRLRRPNDMDNSWYKKMVTCWHEDPDQRPDFGDLVRFLSGHHKQLARTNSMGKIRNREKRLTVSRVQNVTVGEDESPYRRAPGYRPVAPKRHSLDNITDITIYSQSSTLSYSEQNPDYQPKQDEYLVTNDDLPQEDYLSPNNEKNYLLPSDHSQAGEVTKSQIV